MRRIHMSSKALEEYGIQKSSVIMKVYLAIWVSSTIITIAMICLNYQLAKSWGIGTVDNVKTQARICIAITVFLLCQFFMTVCLDLIILTHYWRAGDKIRGLLARNLARSISRVQRFNSSTSLNADSSLDMERLKASRRLKAY